jgi:hypothetical protein
MTLNIMQKQGEKKMERTIASLDVLEDEKVALNTLSNFVDWFSPTEKTNDELQRIIITIGYELEKYRELLGQNKWHR